MTTTTATVAVTDLDRLAERVERAANVIVELRQKNAQLEAERLQLRRQLDETTSRLQGQDPGAILQELGTLKREQREWQTERRDVAARIEAIAAKLEKIEA
jgi:chromosome segregation ATPase